MVCDAQLELVGVAGRRIKGPKAEKTSDYIHVPDLTGLDSGALSMDDIAENYAAVSLFLLFLYLLVLQRIVLAVLIPMYFSCYGVCILYHT